MKRQYKINSSPSMGPVLGTLLFKIYTSENTWDFLMAVNVVVVQLFVRSQSGATGKSHLHVCHELWGLKALALATFNVPPLRGIVTLSFCQAEISKNLQPPLIRASYNLKTLIEQSSFSLLRSLSTLTLAPPSPNNDSTSVKHHE